MNLDYQTNWVYYGHMVQDLPYYGLYEPTNDSLVVVNSNLQTLQGVSLLFSGRFTLYVCELITAKSVLPPLDNTTCTNWTVSNKHEFNVTRAMDLNKVWSVPSLVPSQLPKIWNFAQDQEYLIAACFWIGAAIPRIIETRCGSNPEVLQYNQITHKLAQLPGAPFPEPHLGVVKKIQEIIFTEFNYSKAKPLIDRLLEPYYG